VRGCPGLLFVLLLLACSGRPQRDAGDGTDRARAGSREAVPVVTVAEEPDQLCPPFARSPASAAIWSWILPSLVRVEGDSLGRIRFEGDLATSWQGEDDGRAIRFFLTSNRLWEDTTAVTSDDVIGSYGLYRDPVLGGGWPRHLSDIASIEAPAGQGSVLFRFKRPLSSQRALRLAALPVISMAQWEKVKDRKPLLGEPGRPVSAAGPYRVEEWKPREHLRLARHPFPPAGRTPRARAILLRFIPSGESRAAQLEFGAADCAIDLPSETVARLWTEAPGVRIARAGSVEIEALVWNLDHPLWGARHLRQDLSRRLDRLMLRRAAAGDAPGFLGEACEGFASVPQTGAATQAAGAADTIAASADTLLSLPPFGLLYDVANGRHERMAIEIALELERHGVAVRLLPMPASGCRASIDQRRFDAALMTWRMPADADLGEVWGTGGALNASGLSDPGVDSLVSLARSSAADTLADAWVRVDARARTLDPMIFIGRRPRLDGIGPDLTGYRSEPLEAYGPLLDLEKRPAR